ncbi:MAG: CoA ester lyase [Nocardioides sp.]|uniref:HpcH/HpaI aldolase/citrate lyase family protein n=1 Tax=Nocardioides sp. TaxID=35761 RepID=UPI0039E6F7F3
MSIGNGVMETYGEVPAAPKSWLLAAADREGDVVAALDSAAAAVIFDLESSVTADRKAVARDLLAGLPDRSGRQQRWLRVNAMDTEFYGADLACAEELDLDGIVLPKVEHGAEVARAAGDLVEAGWRIHVIAAETPASLFDLGTFAGSTPLLAAISWGVDDLSAALGASSKFDADGELGHVYRLAQSLTLAAARAAGVQPIDCVLRDVDDLDRLRREAEAARRMGFEGKLAIHPAQVDIINQAFTPTADEIADARAIVAAFQATPDAGLHTLRGRMVDRARLLQARRVLDRAGVC